MGRREANKAKKRAALLESGLGCFLVEGFQGTSVEQIAAGAGIARGTFYLYFEGKEALFEAVLDRFFVPLMAVFDEVESGLAEAGSPDACLAIYQSMALRIAMVGLQERDTVLLLFREMRGQHVPGVRRREVELITRTTGLTQLAMDRELVRSGDARLSSLIILGGIERLYFEVLSGRLDLGEPHLLAGKASVLLSRVLGLGVQGRD